MTKLMEKAIQALRGLPADRQDEIAEAMLAVAQTPAVEYSAAQLAAIDEGIADADAGRFAPDEDVRRLFARFRAA